MKTKMSFQSSLMTAYSAFIATLMVFLGVGFYYYNAFIIERNAYASLRDMAGKMSRQLDNSVQPMDFLAMDIISRSELMSALRNLAYVDRNDYKSTRYIKDGIQVIKDNIIRDSVNRMVYRLSIFNADGDFFTSNYNVESSDNIRLAQKINRLEWLGKARELQGHKYLIPPCADVWAENRPARVFALVRMVRDPGCEIGFVEVQNPAANLTKICSVEKNENINVLVIDDENRVVYSSRALRKNSLRYYSAAVKKRYDGNFFTNPLTKTTEMICHVRSKFTGWTVLLIKDRKAVLASIIFTRNVSLLIGSILMIFAFIFFYLFSLRLTKPLKNLTKAMEEVSIENLPNPLPLKNENNEIESLNRSFQSMRERLNDAIKREIESRSLQLNAHFDALQAQINPHFMYNMLNVLANMGLEAGNEEISDTCRRIAALLRYSTSTEKHQATLKEEIAHVENYLHLMKKRFEHKLEYRIDVDEAICDIVTPKLILQPLVENSIHHGFNNNPGVMQISIKGFIDNHEWRIDIVDNGSGFSKTILDDLELKIESYTKEISDYKGSKGMTIGGMGVISTFARLRMLYGTELRFVINNDETGGACVSIAGPVELNIVNSSTYFLA